MKTTRLSRFLTFSLIGLIALVMASCGTTRGHVEHDFGYDWNSGQYYTPGPGHKPHKAPKPPKHKKHKKEKHGKKPKRHKHDHHDNGHGPH